MPPPNPRRPVVVIADDLSGAAELAGLAQRHGLSAEVQTTFSADTDAEVICVDTDTRLLPPAEAARIAETVAQNAVAAKPAWIFKKCDSVLRGSVLAEARAIARAAGKARIVILSANPSLGRIVRDGNYFVEGVPLPETVFARDPAHPRATASVAALLGGDLAGVSTPDATTPADIARHAAALDHDTLPVGAADFFAALLVVRVGVGPVSDRPSGPDRSETGPTFRQRPSDCMDTVKPTPALDPASPTLLVCGSAASWAQRAAAATAQGIPAFALPHDVGAIVAALQASRRALVGIGDGPATRRLDSSQLVQRLAESVAATVRATPPARLLLEGGATAAAVTRALGWTRLRACEIFPPGVGVLRPAEAAGPLLFIKPGSYAWPPEVWPGLSP